MGPHSLKYIIITAARNEEGFIGRLLQDVVNQTARPLKWIIVSDGSTDRTDEIVKQFADQQPWIELNRLPERTPRNFAGKAAAINLAYSANRALDFDLIVNVDSDVSFERDYFEFILSKFASDPKLGVAGTPYVEGKENKPEVLSIHRHSNPHHVSGQVQVFRKSCFEDVGGYQLVKGGAIDWIAVTTARMKGWQTRSFPEKTFFHHRKMGTAEQGVLQSKFHYGKKAYYVGGHPLWEMVRGIFQMRSRPFIIGGLMHQLGYLWAAVTRVDRPVSPELMAFHRGEQMARMKAIFKPSKSG